MPIDPNRFIPLSGGTSGGSLPVETGTERVGLNRLMVEDPGGGGTNPTGPPGTSVGPSPAAVAAAADAVTGPSPTASPSGPAPSSEGGVSISSGGFGFNGGQAALGAGIGALGGLMSGGPIGAGLGALFGGARGITFSPPRVDTMIPPEVAMRMGLPGMVAPAPPTFAEVPDDPLGLEGLGTGLGVPGGPVGPVDLGNMLADEAGLGIGLGDTSGTDGGGVGGVGAGGTGSSSDPGVYKMGGRVRDLSRLPGGKEPITAHEGEFVVNAPAAQKNLPWLKRINRGGLARLLED